MYLAGHDVWHDVGRPDIWNTPRVPFHDLRDFVVAYSVLLIPIAGQIAITITRGPSSAGSPASATANT